MQGQCEIERPMEDKQRAETMSVVPGILVSCAACSSLKSCRDSWRAGLTICARVQGQCEIERPVEDKEGAETMSVVQGSLVGCAACLSSTRARATVKAVTRCRIAAFGAAEMDAVLVSPYPVAGCMHLVGACQFDVNI